MVFGRFVIPNEAIAQLRDLGGWSYKLVAAVRFTHATLQKPDPSTSSG